MKYPSDQLILYLFTATSTLCLIQNITFFFILCFQQRNICLSLIQILQMRNRYYSPESLSLSPSNQFRLNRSGQQGNIKHSASNNRLPPSSSFSASKKVGAYVYDVSNQIGRGFSSIVYKGVNVRSGLEVAVKVIDFKNYSDSSMKMLQSQIKILKSLDHPNIIKCLDVYRTPSHSYIITEYCKNGDLSEFLAKHGRLQQVATINIMTQIIEGVKYLMRKGIVHRDLKPANILKGEKQWKIADFGFAILTQKKIKSKYNVGTPLYMPLQALVDNVYSPLSDIFSIGIIFYEILTGTTPWESKQEKQLIKKIMGEPYSLPPNYTVSFSIASTLQVMCAADIDQRMNKESFLALNLTYESINPEQKKKLKPQLITVEQKLQKARIKNKSQNNLQVNKEQHSGLTPRIQTKNNHILISQLHYCRFIYYFIKNIKYLQVGIKGRTKLTLALYRHLQKLIGLLSNDKTNYYGLQMWKEFKETQKYESTRNTMKDYASRYRKQQIEYLKEADSGAVEQFKRTFQSLILNQNFTVDCYHSILNLVTNLLRQVNHNLTITIKAKTLTTPQLNASIESLKSLYKYHQLIQLSAQHFCNYQVFEKESNIRVQIDYPSCPNSIEDYHKLRDQLKFI